MPHINYKRGETRTMVVRKEHVTRVCAAYGGSSKHDTDKPHKRRFNKRNRQRWKKLIDLHPPRNNLDMGRYW